MDPNHVKQEKCELTAEAVEYMSQLKVEKENIDPSYAIACRLMNEEIDRVERGAKYTEVHNDKKVKLQEKVLIPVKEHPKFNFVGKLLGPQGNSLKRLQAETGCKMSILGKGSMRDKNKEDELRKGDDPKYQHLNYELHVLVEVFSTPIDAHARMSHALVELRKFLVPDYNDEIRQQQLQELMYINGDEAVAMPPPGPPPGRGRGRGRGVPPPGPNRGRGGALLATPPVRGAPSGRGMMPPRGSPRGAPSPRSRGAGRGLARPPPPVAPPVYEEDYSYGGGYDDQYAYEETYEDSYGAGSSDAYDYGHSAGSAREAVYDDSYGDGGYGDGWGNGVSSKPAPMGKMSSQFRGSGRAHPYGGGARGSRY